MLSINPKQNPSVYDMQKDMSMITAAETVELIGDCSFFTLGWLQVSTMYQLALSIKKIFEELQEKDAQKKRRRMYYFSFSMVIFQISVVVFMSWLSHSINWTLWKLWAVLISTDLTLMICYILTMSYTWKTIRKTITKISDYIDFTDKYRSIKVQFVIFLLAFIFEIIVSIILFVGHDSNWSTLKLEIMHLISKVFIGILPVSCTLYIHHNTFKVKEEMSELITEMT